MATKKRAPVKEIAAAKKEEKQAVEKELPAKDNFAAMAKYFEEEGKPEDAARYYEKAIKIHPTDRTHYNRLMIIYRKQKDRANELRIIDAGIKAFTDFYAPSTSNNTNVVKISKKLNFLVGLTDKKGKSLHDPEPISTWKKRKELLLKKSKK